VDVPLESWQVGPWNRWAYVHVGEVVPTVTVPRGSGPVRALEARPRDAGELDAPYCDGLAVIERGALVHERYGGEMHETSLHLSQSVGKSVLGLTVGLLGLDTAVPVAEHVPEVTGSGYEGATIRHLLDMTAAIDFVEDYEADFWRYDIACGWHPPVPGADARTILDFLPTIGPAAWRHGERFHYATPNTDLLGLVAERAAGMPLAAVIATELWAKLGAEHDAELTVDPAGTAAIGGGFCATLRDYARLGLFVAESDAAWIDALGARELARPTDPGIISGASGYAGQWWRRDGRLMARGIHGQLIAVDRERELVVTILSSWPDATDPELEAAHRALVARF
jgi:CubicO group peptidase (beta-lactamase class C family)